VTLHFSYLTGYDEYISMQEKLDEAVERAVSDIEDFGVLRKLYYIHDLILQNTEYDLDALFAGTPYGALVDKKAKCDGYSHAFQMIAGKAGIECVTVISEPDGSEYGHVWNKVKVANSWYNIDISSDDTTLKWDEICYDYFLLADTEMGVIHNQWDDPFIVEPSAKNLLNSYYEIKKRSAKSVEEAKEILSAQFEAVDFDKTNTAYAAVEINDKGVLDEFVKLYKAGEIMTAEVLYKTGTAEAFINPERQVVHIKVTL
jgi:hypothetical protein